MNKGLSELEAERLLQIHGLNALGESKKISALKIFAKQFCDVLIIILIFSIIASAFLDEMVEAMTILIIIIVNAWLGFIQEYKTEKTLQELKKMAGHKVRVCRNGENRVIGAEFLVPGDIIYLESGDRVPADAILLESHSIKADESILTGESCNVDKKNMSSLGAKKDLKEAMIFMGSMITVGRGIAKVLKTGMSTEMGSIAVMLSDIETESTPLQKKLSSLGTYIAIGCLLICALVACVGIIKGENIIEMVLAGISLAVASIPEGLPAIVTISLAMGLQRMLKKNVLVRRLPVVETLGCANIICSDKTGTITQNKMEVRSISTASKTWDNPDKIMDSDFETIVEIGAVCNNAEIQNSAKVSCVDNYYGDPLEVALVLVCNKVGKDILKIRTKFKRIGENPFDSERKIMSVLVKDKEKRSVMCKGAPEVLLEKCKLYLLNGKEYELTSEIKRKILLKNEAMTSKALRVIAVGYKTADDLKDNFQKVEIAENNLVFAGLIGMIDPPRKEVYQSVQVCKRAGIRPIMITGDHRNTAEAIGREVGILQDGEKAVIGEELEGLSKSKFLDVIRKTNVFARVSPKHKIMIVKALKEDKNIVAMTGDGVNDAPAVKEADIGISMGVSGTDVTKEASTMVLLDDNFATIVSAVREGRVIYSNIRKFIRYMLSCNIGEVVTMFIGALIGLPMPLLPIQILWVNLVTDGLPAIALGLEPGEDDIMNNKPRKYSEGIFSNGLLGKILYRGILIGLATLGVYVYLLYLGRSLEIARTGAFLTLIMTQLVYVFHCKTENNRLKVGKLGNNPWLLIAVGISFVMAIGVVYLPMLNNIFHVVPIGIEEWGFVIIATILAILIL